MFYIFSIKFLYLVSVLNHKKNVTIHAATSQMNITLNEPTVKTVKKENIKFQLLAIKVLV